MHLPYSAAVLPEPECGCKGCLLPGPKKPTPDVHAMESATDLQRLSNTVRRLSACGFYYEGLALNEAAKALQSAPVGTFLVRDSADPRFLFALSVRTERGPTSVRIHYSQGYFRLDAEHTLQDAMPSFECVLELIDYYVRLSQTDKARAHVWLDQTGRRDLHIRLSKPLYRRVATLQHLCRTTLAVHVPREQLGRLPLPPSLTAFVKDYPYPQ